MPERRTARTKHSINLTLKVKNPDPMPGYTSYNTMSSSYTPLPGVMTALALRTSLILGVGFHAVCRCTISCAQADSEARIPGITMTARVDIFTKAVTSNPQSAQPKCLNQICNSHPDLTEETTNVHLIPPLTLNTDTRKQTRSLSTEIQTNHFPPPLLVRVRANIKFGALKI